MKIAEDRIEILQVCKLIQCVRENKVDEIIKLVENGLNGILNFIEPSDGLNALMVAAKNNNDEIVFLLLDRLKADPNVKNKVGFSALTISAMMGHVQSLNILLKYGADPQLCDIYGKTTLFYTLSPTNRHFQCVENLLLSKGDPNVVDNEGDPLLNRACLVSNEIEDICKLIIESNADAAAQNKKTGYTALMAACRAGSSMIVKMLLKNGADPNAKTRSNKMAGHEAAEVGNLECLFMLAGYNANFNVTSNSGDSPIHLASKNGHHLCCRFLVQRGCNPKLKNFEDYTAKLYAKENSHKEALRECKKAEKIYAKVNDNMWSTLLYDYTQIHTELTEAFEKYECFDDDSLAFLTGKMNEDDFIIVLQDFGAPIPDDLDLQKSLIASHDKLLTHKVDYYEFMSGRKYVNRTFLHKSYLPKQKKKKKSGGKSKSSKNKIPMQICVQDTEGRVDNCAPNLPFVIYNKNYTDRNRFNRDNIPSNPLVDDSFWYLNQPEAEYIKLNDASKYTEIDSLQLAFKNGVDVNFRNKFYKTPLMAAAYQGNLETAKYLISKGASINISDNMYWTPLHFACHGGCLLMVQYLVDNGAHLDALTMSGATPLNRAIETSREDIVMYLISKGAKLQLESNKVRSIFEEAQLWGDSRVFDIISKKWSSLPPLNDKKPKKSKSAKKVKKRTSKFDTKEMTEDSAEWFENYFASNKLDSILITAFALMNTGADESILHTIEKDWINQHTTEELIQQRVLNRKRFGWLIDFDNYEKPFQSSISRIIKEDEEP